jgi:hypothetical protein
MSWYPQQEQHMGHGLFNNVHPQMGKNTGWSLTSRRPLPPALFKRPNHMLNTDFESMIGPPAVTTSPFGNQVWLNQQQRRLSLANAKVHGPKGALDHFSLFPEAIATGGGGAPGNVYGYTFKGYGNAGNVRWIPFANNKRKPCIDERTRLGDKAYAKPGGLFGQEVSQLGAVKLPKNGDIYEVPHRGMLPSKNPAGMAAGPEDVVLNPMRRCDDDVSACWVGPKASAHGERPFHRDQTQQRVDTKQSVTTGYLMYAGGRPYGDIHLNGIQPPREGKKDQTQWAGRPPNPGYIGGLEYIGDAQLPIRNKAGGARWSKRQENIDYEFNRLKVPTVTYALQYNQQFPWKGDRRRNPEIRMSPDSAILAQYHRNPFSQPLNPYARKEYAIPEL